MSNFQVYADGGRLVAEGSNYGQMAAACLVEMKRPNRRSCGVYRENEDGLLALFELSRDRHGRLHQWHRLGPDIPIDGSIPGMGLIELFHNLATRHRALLLQMRQTRARLAELEQFANPRTSEQSRLSAEIERHRESLRAGSIIAMTLRDVGRQILGTDCIETDENPFDPTEVDY